MSQEDPYSVMQYMWVAVSAPIAFLYHKIYSMRAETSKIDAIQQENTQRMIRIEEKLDIWLNLQTSQTKDALKLWCMDWYKQVW